MHVASDQHDDSKGPETKDDLLEARFSFLRDDIILVAQVNARTGRQRLLVQQVNQETGGVLRETSIDCIHVAVCDTTADELDGENQRRELEEASLHIRSSEELTEIHLTPEEKFTAFKSWAAGIAEAGMGAFHIQEEIDTAARLQIPVVTPILQFLAGVDISYIFQYLEYVDRSATYAGIRHDNFIIASLIPMLEILKDSKLKTPEISAILDQIFVLTPPLSLFLEQEEFFHFLLAPSARETIERDITALG